MDLYKVVHHSTLLFVYQLHVNVPDVFIMIFSYMILYIIAGTLYMYSSLCVHVHVLYDSLSVYRSGMMRCVVPSSSMAHTTQHLAMCSTT